jgi:hypothetical protein
MSSGEADSVNMEDIRWLQAVNGDRLHSTLNLMVKVLFPPWKTLYGPTYGNWRDPGGRHAIDIHVRQWPGP